MNTIAVIISIIALVGAGFAFIRASSAYNMLTKRINKLKDTNSDLEARLRRLEGNANRGGTRASGEQTDGGRPKKQRPEQQRSEQREQQRQEQQRQEQQPEQRQRPRERQQPAPQAEETADPQQQPKRRRERRRRNEPSDRTNPEGNERAAPAVASGAARMEFSGSDLLDELEQAATTTPPPVEPEAMPELTPDTGTRFAIIPEDGVIRQHQLQQHPDSDSYIEMDLPNDNSSTTRYRFNLAGNHAFVISQGIDRLENAFDFEKPSNRMVSRVVLQGDGILVKVNNGWRIQEKARIDFR